MRTHPLRTIGFLALCLSGCVSTSTRSVDPIRVLVYNIHAGKDARGVGNLERVSEIIRSAQAHLVLLQEVDNRTRRSGGVDQLSRLRELTGMFGVFGKTIDYDGGEYGIAILSRWAIASSRLVPLPVTIDDSAVRARYEARGALVVRIKEPSGDIRVVNTHLDASRNDSIRIQQANALIFVANEQRKNGFTILGGDFNAEPDSRVAKMFPEDSWRDLFLACNGEGGLTFPADKPVKRIDYLFGSVRVVCTAASVIETDASDHRPIVVEVLPYRPR